MGLLKTCVAAAVGLSLAVGCSSLSGPPESTREEVGTTREAATAVIPVFATGVNAAGAALAAGATDPHYAISATTDPVNTAPRVALVVGNAQLGGGWVANTGTAMWVSVDASNCGACGNFSYDYITTFNLPSGATPSTASLSGSVAADDNVVIALNGNTVATFNSTWNTLQNFSVPAGGAFFAAGTNTLRFRVSNSGSGPTGLHVRSLAVSVTAQCVIDGDCTAAQFCNGNTLACAAKLANGTLVSNDPLHNNGICNAAAGSAVCTSAVCDTADNRCGLANGSGACTSGNGGVVCRAGVCDPDLKCGLANGHGPCTVANQTAVCRSGACGAGSSVCIPVGGCAADGDCAATDFCNGTTKTCTPKLANGTLVSNDPLHNNGVCNGAVGTAVCTSGVCDTTDNKCGFVNGNGTCNGGNAATVCRAGVCDPDTKCGLANGSGVCTVGNQAVVCRSGTCGATSGKCTPATGCASDTDCTTAQFCNGNTLLCAPKLPNGTAVSNDPLHNAGVCNSAVGAAVCLAGVCSPADNQCGLPNGSGPCTPADQGQVCRSGTCGVGSGTCVPATNGCASDTDCAATSFCNGNTFTCTPKLPNGTAVPNDPLHNAGVCNPAVGTSVCVSGVCDTTDNQCGLPNGVGPCTPINGERVCRSGICTNEVCAAAPDGGAPDGGRDAAVDSGSNGDSDAAPPEGAVAGGGLSCTTGAAGISRGSSAAAGLSFLFLGAVFYRRRQKVEAVARLSRRSRPSR